MSVGRPQNSRLRSGCPIVPPAVRIGVIDVGTNAAKLLVADKPATGRLHVVTDRVQVVRLGTDLRAWDRLLEVVRSFKVTAEALGAVRIVVVGTSKSRDIGRRMDLVSRVRKLTGLDYIILPGAEEAEWSFRGAMAALPQRSKACTTLDIGGGSTEIVTAGDGLPVCRSLNIGSVRIRERFFKMLPPAPSVVARVASLVQDQLRGLRISAAAPLVGASLTPRLLLMLECGESELSESPRRRLSASTVRRWRVRLLSMTRAEVLALNPVHMAGRDDVFPAAVLILDAVMRHFGFEECIVSPWGLRHGLAAHYAGGHGTSDPAIGE